MRTIHLLLVWISLLTAIVGSAFADDEATGDEKTAIAILKESEIPFGTPKTEVEAILGSEVEKAELRKAPKLMPGERFALYAVVCRGADDAEGLWTFTAWIGVLYRDEKLASMGITLQDVRSRTWIFSGEQIQHSDSDEETRIRNLVAQSTIFAQEMEKRKKPAQPGATDNPDDAQRLREDH